MIGWQLCRWKSTNIPIPTLPGKAMSIIYFFLGPNSPFSPVCYKQSHCQPGPFFVNFLLRNPTKRRHFIRIPHNSLFKNFLPLTIFAYIFAAFFPQFHKYSQFWPFQTPPHPFPPLFLPFFFFLLLFFLSFSSQNLPSDLSCSVSLSFNLCFFLVFFFFFFCICACFRFWFWF